MGESDRRDIATGWPIGTEGYCFSRDLGDLNGAPALTSPLHLLRVYRRSLRTAEAVGDFRAGSS